MNKPSNRDLVVSGSAEASCVKRSARKAFTLVELLAVIVIMAILSMLVVGLWRYAQRKAYEARARAELQKLSTAVEEYRIKNGKFPKDLSYVVSTLEGGFTIVTNFPADPWGETYKFQLNQSSYRLFSTGVDKRSGSDTNRMDDIEAGKI